MCTLNRNSTAHVETKAETRRIESQLVGRLILTRQSDVWNEPTCRNAIST